MPLIPEPNLTGHDDLCADLLDAHEGLSRVESGALNARLMLILANHIGDPQVVRQALDAARRPAASE